MRLAVFDLDGTLADTAADLIAAANAALAEEGLGRALDPGRDAAVAFAGGRAMLRRGLAGPDGVDEAAVERLYPRLLARYGEAIAVETRLYDGAEAALARLDADGWGLAICTNKPEGLAVRLLDALGIGGRFRAVVGADTFAYRKPDPRHLTGTIARAGGVPEWSVLVGDTVNDREAARAAGVPCVLVGFGPEGAGAAALEPEAMLGHFAELPALLERLVPDAG
ncbi:MAG: HAD-IA family hydrolase [Amaricoccus sp.]